jgi:hypothetical protein
VDFPPGTVAEATVTVKSEYPEILQVAEVLLIVPNVTLDILYIEEQVTEGVQY